jgi:uncharacterized tellurite resistance protein B-like protein
MLDKISQFFKSITEISNEEISQTVSLEIACAVLLCEIMRADQEFAEAEQNKLAELLSEHFQLSNLDVEQVIAQALDHSENSSDLYTYTSLINKHYVIEDKITLVNMLWQLADADGEIAAIESHTIRKIADLLHLRHSEYIATKLTH